MTAAKFYELVVRYTFLKGSNREEVKGKDNEDVVRYTFLKGSNRESDTTNIQ